MICETERLVLRTVRPSDRDVIARIWASPVVTKHLGGMRERAAVRRALREYHDPEAQLDLWAVEEKATGRVIGHCGLLPRRLFDETIIEIIYVLGSRAWGKGYATEVATALLERAWALRVPKVYAFIEPGNQGSIHVARKLRMRHERSVLLPDGRLEHVYVRSRPRRPAKRPPPETPDAA